MGRKNIIPYGLYKTYGFISPQFTRQTGVNSEDLAHFWEALVKCFEMDRSSARGLMATQGVWIFSHESALGNYPTHKLFDLLKIKSLAEYPRHFKDYQVNMNPELPPGISLTYLS